MKTYKYFHLYQDTIIVKGWLNTLLTDHYKGMVINIPNLFVDNKIIDNCYLYNCAENETLISLLSKDDFGYFTNDINDIKKSFTWKSPKNINEIIIEHRKNDSLDIETVYNQIENVGAEFIQIRFLDYCAAKMSTILHLLEYSCIRTIEILVPFITDHENEEIITILSKNSRVQIVYFYNAPFNKSIQYNNLFNVLFYKKDLTDVKLCGIIDEDYFMTDLKNISKSVFHNNCLKDKLYISSEGIIKNCPSIHKSWGNINNMTLKEVFSVTDFNKYRNINKDSIEVCRDCEYRYICIDCRAFTERTHIDAEDFDSSKPLKCGYDPYTGEWEEWSTNLLKQKAILHYGMDEIF